MDLWREVCRLMYNGIEKAGEEMTGKIVKNSVGNLVLGGSVHEAPFLLSCLNARKQDQEEGPDEKHLIDRKSVV